MSPFPPAVQAKAERAVQRQDAMLRRAIALGVRIALGTDAAVYPHGHNALEFLLMSADGMTPAQALKAGTSSAAELLADVSAMIVRLESEPRSVPLVPTRARQIDH